MSATEGARSLAYMANEEPRKVTLVGESNVDCDCGKLLVRRFD